MADGEGMAGEKQVLGVGEQYPFFLFQKGLNNEILFFYVTVGTKMR